MENFDRATPPSALLLWPRDKPTMRQTRTKKTKKSVWQLQNRMKQERRRKRFSIRYSFPKKVKNDKKKRMTVSTNSIDFSFLVVR